MSRSGFSRCGRAQWVRLGGTPGGDLSILNVYASTSARERMELWTELVTCLDKDCKWILSGDWNFVEQSTDKSNMCGKLYSMAEWQAFEALLGALDLEEKFSTTSPIKYSWDNKCRDCLRILARLDRIYSFQAGRGQCSPIDEYYIKGNSNHSDHLLVGQIHPQGSHL